MTGTVNTRSVEQTSFSMSMILIILLFPVCVVMQWMVILFLILRVHQRLNDRSFIFCRTHLCNFFFILIWAVFWNFQKSRFFYKWSIILKCLDKIILLYESKFVNGIFFTTSIRNSLLITEKRITWCFDNIPFWKRIPFLAPGLFPLNLNR